MRLIYSPCGLLFLATSDVMFIFAILTARFGNFCGHASQVCCACMAMKYWLDSESHGMMVPV